MSTLTNFFRGGDMTRVPIPPSFVGVLYNSLPIVVLSFGFWDQYADYLQSQSLSGYRNHAEKYDFVIGAGSAGCVLANRLSADPNNQVLLLENGGNPNPMQSVPGYFGAMVHIPQIDYDYYTVPQRNSCLALKGQKSFWPRGKGLGGSSNLNAMIYQRANPNDYDRWAELAGSDEWKFDNLLKHFKNIEDYHGEYFNEELHSQNGKGVYVSISSEEHLYPEFLQAAREMGYPVKDVNGRQEASFSRLDVTIKDGRRFGAYPAFVEPVLKRNNLKIYRYAHVVKVELDQSRKARGVIYHRHGVEHIVMARKEVILSAGSIDTPKLLMLSGIGPKRHLEQLGIKCKVDLPVGKNLQDHIMSTIGPFNLETKGSFNPSRDITVNMISEYFTSHRGMLAAPLFNNAVGYIHSSVARNKMQTENISATQVSPDIQLVLLPCSPGLDSNMERFGNLKEGYLKPYFHAPDGKIKDGFFVNVMLAKYNSRGELKLASSNPKDKPIINPRYFSHPDDIKIMIDGVNFTVTMVEKTRAFQQHGAQLTQNHLPGCEHFPLKSEQYYECYIRHLTLTVYHHCGTATMGKGVGDPKAVVDPKLRVLKTKHLRVVDASIIPEVPNANLNSIVYMIADKASEMILEYWDQQEKLTKSRL